MILEKIMTHVPGRIMISEQKIVATTQDLQALMMSAIADNLEGLVIKDSQSMYKPGKRHWLKMKKDYLDSGRMADSADLVVLGAYYGTGIKGGTKSVFLMGVYDEDRALWVTVTKVAATVPDISMIEIGKDATKVPDWLCVARPLVPDFVVHDPKSSQVWELTGAQFSNSKTHTADGISIRFPRVTRVREDKGWQEATSLEHLKALASKH